MSDVANHSTKCLNTDSKAHEFIILNVQNLAHVKSHTNPVHIVSSKDFDTPVRGGLIDLTTQTQAKQHKLGMVINSPKHCTVCEDIEGKRKQQFLQSKSEKQLTSPARTWQ